MTTNLSTHRPLPSIVSDDDTLVNNDDSAMSDVALPAHVSFADKDTIYEIPTRSSFSEDEGLSIWYKKDDYQAMKEAAMETIALDRSGGLQAGNLEYDMRGLECRTLDGFAQRKQNRLLSLASVVDEQDRQDEMGISDPDLIARIYAELCVHSQYVAFARGLFDAQELVVQMTSTSPSDIQAGEADSAAYCKETSDFQVPGKSILMQMGLGMQDKEEMARTEAGFQILVQELDDPPVDRMEWSSAEAA